MTNPISSLTVGQLPPYTQPIVNPDGTPTIDWGQFFFALSERTGGTGVGYNIGEIQAQTQEALTIATETAAGLVVTNENVASVTTIANTANVTANTANSLAITANAGIAALDATALLMTGNLSGLADLNISRANLGVDTFPLIFQIDSANSGINRVIPLWRPLTFAINFNGSAGYCLTAPASDVTISIGYIRSGVTSFAGSITFYAGGQIGFFSAQPAFSTDLGDVLILTGTSDPLFSGIGITLLTTIG